MMNRKLLVILLFIAFWFEGDTLFWINKQGVNQSNFLRLQLDHKNPPTINTELIRSIKVTDKEVFIIAGKKCWILHYDQNPQGLDWYIEDPFNI